MSSSNFIDKSATTSSLSGIVRSGSPWTGTRRLIPVPIGECRFRWLVDTILRQEVMDRHGSEWAIGMIGASAHARQGYFGAGGEAAMVRRAGQVRRIASSGSTCCTPTTTRTIRSPV